MARRPTSDPSSTALYLATNSVAAGPSGGFRPSCPGERRGGRAKGTPNKSTATLKDAILRAAWRDELKPGKWPSCVPETSGQRQSRVLALPILGKVLPKEIGADVTVRHTLEDFIMASYREDTLSND